jgi:2-haloalkanoic acid dehalogenase type II
MKYKAILLDFYGTCVAEDDPVIDGIIARIKACTTASHSEILASWVFSEACYSSFGSSFRTQKDIEVFTLQAVLDKFGAALDVQELSAELFQYWSRPALYLDTLEFLQRQQVPVFIVSNIDDVFLESAAASIDFDFHGIITSEQVRAYKPRPEMFERALDLSGYQADEVVHIGDSYSSDVLGAHACGIDVVWVNRKKRPKQNGVMKFEVSTLSEIQWPK